MTHKDTTMLERCTRAAFDGFGEQLLWAEPVEGNPAKCTVGHVTIDLNVIVRSVLQVLKTPSEGMVRAASLAFLECAEDRSRKDGFERPMLIAAIDYVLNEGEG